MNNLNTVLIEGQLTRDPELGPSPAQTQMCRLSVASNRYRLDEKGAWQQIASYFTVHVYGNVAGACMVHLKKGRGVRIVGRLKQRSWQVDGIWHEKIYILAEHIEFQPVKKTEPAPVPEQKGFSTRSNLHGIEDVPSDAVKDTDPIPEPDTSEDSPVCTLEQQDESEIQTVVESDEDFPPQESEQDYYEPAAGF